MQQENCPELPKSAGGPAILCQRLPDFDCGQLETVRQAFYNIVPCPLKQFWLDEPQREFAPGHVFTGWRSADVFVFAELNDTDIFTSANRNQQKLWTLGDTFEIFLCRPDQDQYYEFHIAPNNLTLQLCFPDAQTAKRVAKTRLFEQIMMARS